MPPPRTTSTSTSTVSISFAATSVPAVLSGDRSSDRSGIRQGIGDRTRRVGHARSAIRVPDGPCAIGAARECWRPLTLRCRRQVGKPATAYLATRRMYMSPVTRTVSLATSPSWHRAPTSYSRNPKTRNGHGNVPSRRVHRPDSSPVKESRRHRPIGSPASFTTTPEMENCGGGDDRGNHVAAAQTSAVTATPVTNSQRSLIPSRYEQTVIRRRAGEMTVEQPRPDREGSIGTMMPSAAAAS